MTIVNDKIIKTVSNKDGFINIPLEITFDFEGRGDAVREYETNVIKDIINPPQDSEITKFAHSTYTAGMGPFINNVKTSINYKFYFYNFLSEVTASTISNWAIDYQNASFTDNEIYYFANSFKGSFFKLDFYDTNVSENQRILLSVILPTQQGLKENGLIGPPNNLVSVQVKKPDFVLDYTGADKEGFFIYWLRKQNFINISQFYMSAKFFNGSTGIYATMVNQPQFQIPNPYTFNGDNYFYYKVNLNYNDKTYQAYRTDNNIQRVGLENNPIVWFEYVNP